MFLRLSASPRIARSRLLSLRSYGASLYASGTLATLGFPSQFSEAEGFLAGAESFGLGFYAMLRRSIALGSEPPRPRYASDLRGLLAGRGASSLRCGVSALTLRAFRSETFPRGPRLGGCFKNNVPSTLLLRFT